MVGQEVFIVVVFHKDKRKKEKVHGGVVQLMLKLKLSGSLSAALQSVCSVSFCSLSLPFSSPLPKLGFALSSVQEKNTSNPFGYLRAGTHPPHPLALASAADRKISQSVSQQAAVVVAILTSSAFSSASSDFHLLPSHTCTHTITDSDRKLAYFLSSKLIIVTNFIIINIISHFIVYFL